MSLRGGQNLGSAACVNRRLLAGGGGSTPGQEAGQDFP